MTKVEKCFVDAAKNHGAATRAGDVYRANQEHKYIVSYIKNMRNLPDKGVKSLMTQLNNNDGSIVIWASLYLLPFKEREAIEALYQVAMKKIPRLSLDAEMTLREWRAGRLKIE